MVKSYVLKYTARKAQYRTAYMCLLRKTKSHFYIFMEVLNLRFKKGWMEAVDLYTDEFIFLTTKTELTWSYRYYAFWTLQSWSFGRSTGKGNKNLSWLLASWVFKAYSLLWIFFFFFNWSFIITEDLLSAICSLESGWSRDPPLILVVHFLFPIS